MIEPMLLWGLGLLLLAVLLIIVEVLVPSGGLIGVVAIAASLGAIVCFWRVDAWWGLSSILAVLVLAPSAMAFAFRIWPNTPVGRRMILGAEDEDQLASDRAERVKLEEARQALVGARGVAVTDLRPIGVVRIEGERVEALAEGGVIPAGSSIRVSAVEANQIRVRQVV